jgi:hypothetical protein
MPSLFTSFFVHALVKQTTVSLWIGDRLVRIGLGKNLFFLRRVPFYFWFQLPAYNGLIKSAWQFIMRQQLSFRQFHSASSPLYEKLKPLVLVDYRVENHSGKRSKWRRINPDRLKRSP